MKRYAIVGATAFLIGGCAIPVPLQVASWVIDGVSYVATQKSVTDHGISIVAQQDCAIWRGVTEGELCRVDENDGVAIALAETQPAPGDTGDTVDGLPTPIIENSADIESLANFETAAGGDADAGTQPSPSLPVESLAVEPLAVEPLAVEPLAVEPQEVELEASKDIVLDEPLEVADLRVVAEVAADVSAVLFAAPTPIEEVAAATPVPAMPQRMVVLPGEPLPGRYLVLGSFRFAGNARVLRNEVGGLGAAILAARIGSRTVYRVAVGPYAEAVEQTLRSRLAKEGFANPWAIRVRPGEWTLEAGVHVKRKITELASR